MTKENVDLDDELNNENLDFLEDEDAHEDSKNHSAVSYKPPFNFHNFSKQLLILVGVIITGIIILGVIMNARKKHHAINVIPKVSSTTTAITHTDPQPTIANSQHQSPQHKEEHPTVIQPPLASTIAPEHHNEQKDLSAVPTVVPTVVPTTAAPLAQPSPIGQIKPTPLSSEQVTWQELKKSIDQNQSPMHTPIDQVPVTANNHNLEINIPIGGFERITTTSQIAQEHANNSYKAQEQHIQELKTIIANITQELTANVNQIKELQNNLREISRSISNVNNSVTGVDSKILNLTNTVDGLSMDVKNVKKYIQEEDLDLTANLRPAEPDLFSNTPEYVVHAVIPGRAWLKSSNGQIITIAEGDSLGDYGKIALIDAANNIVRTSSGVTFR